MHLLCSPRALQVYRNQIAARGESVGFVPTMGALHEGHLSLVQRCRKQNKRTVVSIFVNPLQFGPKEDFTRYPRPVKQDLALLQEAGVDAVFLPKAHSLKLDSMLTPIVPQHLSNLWCGAARPDHFTGVATIVSILFNLVRPHTAYFGQKDYQQLAIIKAMVRSLWIPVRVLGCPIVRDHQGLALSSRNQYLSDLERTQACAFAQMFRHAAKDNLRSPQAWQNYWGKKLGQLPGIRVEYCGIAQRDTLEHAKKRQPGKQVALTAVRVGQTRLIDNHLV